MQNFNKQPGRWRSPNETIVFQLVCAGLGFVLAFYACSQTWTRLTRPEFTTSAYFTRTQQATPEDADGLVAGLIFDSEILADHAANRALRALETSVQSQSDRTKLIREAQKAAQAALAVRPVNSSMWLILSLLQAETKQPAATALKMSFITGPIPPEAIPTRLRIVATTPAAADDDIKVLSQSDLRTLLDGGTSNLATLLTIYQQASPAGMKFILDGATALDPKLAKALGQYR